MSSIIGIYQTNGSLNPEWIQKAQAVSAWWQPAAQHHIQTQQVALAHNSLSDTVKLPFQNKTKELTITSTTRIDNKKELVKEHRLEYTISDADLILFLYQKFGKETPKHIIGAFAFIIWDEKEQRLFCARDQMGVEPIYYYFKNGLLIIATEKKAILSIPAVDKTPDWDYWFLRSITPALTAAPESTEYLHIKRLLPAHLMTVQKGEIKKTAYWSFDIHQRTVFKNEQDYTDAFLEHLERAIGDRMDGSDIIGSHLSGGLDSSGVTGMAQHIAQKTGKTLHTFSYTVPKRFENLSLPFENENPFVDAQIEFSKIKNAHKIVQPRFRSFKEILDLETSVMDGIPQTNNLHTEYEIQYAAHQNGVPIVLSGFAGDELVTSFVRAYYLEYLDKGQFVKYFKSRTYAGVGRLQLLAPFATKVAKKVGWKSAGKKMNALYYQRMQKKYERPSTIEKHLFKEDYLKTNPSIESALNLSPYPDTHEELPTSLAEYQRNHVCRQHTSRRMESENQAGRQFKVNYRYPFTDIRLLQYVLSIPVEQKWSPDSTRYLYRKSMKDYMHPSILQRNNKQGSLKPMNSFYRMEALKSLYEKYDDLMEKGYLDFVDPQKVQKYRLFKQVPKNFMMYLMIGQLREQGKLVF